MGRMSAEDPDELFGGSSGPGMVPASSGQDDAGTATDPGSVSECVEVVDTKGGLGTHYRVDIGLPDGSTLTLKN